MCDITLTDFLKEGYIVRTKHWDSPNWVSNIVYRIDNESIEMDMGLEKKYIENLVMIGDTMKCKFSTNEYEYTIEGWITSINTDSPQSITLKVHRIEKFDNIRNSQRFDVYLSAVIKGNRGDSSGVFAIITNISPDGVALLLNKNIEELLGEDGGNSTVCVDVFVTPENIIYFEGVPVRESHMERGVEYGIKIIDIDLESEKRLVDFINELANKDKEFYNKRSGFWFKHSKYNK